MANGWSKERKAKQRKAIHDWRPWERSTGPKTESGKRIVARNAFKHGTRSREHIAEMRVWKEWLAEMNGPGSGIIG